jgi:hypothetical protein
MAIKQAIVTCTRATQGSTYALEVNESVVSVLAGPSDTPTTLMAALAAAINAKAELAPVCTAGAVAGTLTINEDYPSSLDQVLDVSTYLGQGTLTLGGTKTTGNSVTATFNSRAVPYVALSGDADMTAVALGLKNALVADGPSAVLATFTVVGPVLTYTEKVAGVIHAMIAAAQAPQTMVAVAETFGNLSVAVSQGTHDFLSTNISIHPVDPESYGDLSASTGGSSKTVPALATVPGGAFVGDMARFAGDVEVGASGQTCIQPGQKIQRIVSGGVDTGSQP